MERGTSLPTLPTPKLAGMDAVPDDYLDYNFIKRPKKQFKLPLTAEGSSSDSLPSVSSSKQSSRRKQKSNTSSKNASKNSSSFINLTVKMPENLKNYSNTPRYSQGSYEEEMIGPIKESTFNPDIAVEKFGKKLKRIARRNRSIEFKRKEQEENLKKTNQSSSVDASAIEKNYDN